MSCVTWIVRDLEQVTNLYKRVLSAKVVGGYGPVSIEEFSISNGGGDYWTIVSNDIVEESYSVAMLEFADGFRLELVRLISAGKSRVIPMQGKRSEKNSLTIEVVDLEKASAYLIRQGFKLLETLERQACGVKVKRCKYFLDPWENIFILVQCIKS